MPDSKHILEIASNSDAKWGSSVHQVRPLRWGQILEHSDNFEGMIPCVVKAKVTDVMMGRYRSIVPLAMNLKELLVRAVGDSQPKKNKKT